MSTEVSFRARARTLDMLGRQQIAGIPTAISELFKNAHDADAERVEVDYYRRDELFVLRDDGFGMQTEEFIDRWLTIATETSIQRKREERQRRPPSRGARRPILGEKGIGRLAIATIAPQVLVLTRALRDGVLSDLTAAFLNWRVFQCPGLNLQDIRIPLRTFPGGTLPSAADVADMVESFLNRNAGLQQHMDEEEWAEIQGDLEAFAVDPLETAKLLGEPTLLNGGHGTHFYLLPASDNLVHDLEGDPASGSPAPLHKALLGFTTPSFAGDEEPVIRTAFRDHRTDGVCEDLIGEHEFFTRYDYENADHQVLGRFDEYGQFKGSVSVYGEVRQDHVINWSGGSGRPTACGPFRITFAAIEGVARHSTLPPAEHGRMMGKTSRIGGLYVYRDGVRIQPYGNTDYDWLEIELRRTKSASYYYFSYRQMFGVVEVNSTNNESLREKAGREGFRENKAYRELRSILRSFLVQVAADFFREEGVYSERFKNRKRELDEAERHRRARAKTVTAKRDKLRQDLTSFFARMEEERPLDSVMELGVATEERVKEASLDTDRGRAARRILQIERNARETLENLEASYRISKPRIGLSRALRREWGDYQEAFQNLVDGIRDLRTSIESVVTQEMSKAGVDISARERMDSALDELSRLARRETDAGRREVNARAKNISEEVRSLTIQCVQDVEDAIRAGLADFDRRDLSDLDEQRLISVRSDLETPIREALENAKSALDAVRSQLEAVDLSSESSLL